MCRRWETVFGAALSRVAAPQPGGHPADVDDVEECPRGSQRGAGVAVHRARRGCVLHQRGCGHLHGQQEHEGEAGADVEVQLGEVRHFRQHVRNHKLEGHRGEQDGEQDAGAVCKLGGGQAVGSEGQHSDEEHEAQDVLRVVGVLPPDGNLVMHGGAVLLHVTLIHLQLLRNAPLRQRHLTLDQREAAGRKGPAAVVARVHTDLDGQALAVEREIVQVETLRQRARVLVRQLQHARVHVHHRQAARVNQLHVHAVDDAKVRHARLVQRLRVLSVVQLEAVAQGTAGAQVLSDARHQRGVRPRHEHAEAAVKVPLDGVNRLELPDLQPDGHHARRVLLRQRLPGCPLCSIPIVLVVDGLVQLGIFTGVDQVQGGVAALRRRHAHTGLRGIRVDRMVHA
mmetsp:Transcript_36779/g.94045  ORF Transcript_36779/g.94045 Transcript_36779/m.94045 type:complete len:397 (-) Transcript_36779:182-1372(-)